MDKQNWKERHSYHKVGGHVERPRPANGRRLMFLLVPTALAIIALNMSMPANKNGETEPSPASQSAVQPQQYDRDILARLINQMSIGVYGPETHAALNMLAESYALREPAHAPPALDFVAMATGGTPPDSASEELLRGVAGFVGWPYNETTAQTMRLALTSGYMDKVYTQQARAGQAVITIGGLWLPADGSNTTRKLSCLLDYDGLTAVGGLPESVGSEFLNESSVEVVGLKDNLTREQRSELAAGGIGYFAPGVICLKQANGITVGFLAFDAAMPGQSDERFITAVESARREGAQIIVSAMTAADGAPTAEQRRQARLAINAGSDLVVFWQPDAQGIELYNDRCIIYGLGTLSADPQTDAYLFRQGFSVNDGGSVTTYSPMVIPCPTDEGQNAPSPAFGDRAQQLVQTLSERSAILAQGLRELPLWSA